MWVIPCISLLKCCIRTLYFPVSLSFFHLDAVNLKSKWIKHGNISFSSLLCYRPVSEWFQVPKFGGMVEAECLWWKEPISPFSSACVSPVGTGVDEHHCLVWVGISSNQVGVCWVEKERFQADFKKGSRDGERLSSIVASALSARHPHLYSSFPGTMIASGQSSGEFTSRGRESRTHRKTPLYCA